MDAKLALTEKEIPASYAYDYADREGVTHLLKMGTLGHSFDFSNYAVLVTGELKGLAYSEEEVEGAMAELPKISSGSIYY